MPCGYRAVLHGFPSRLATRPARRLLRAIREQRIHVGHTGAGAIIGVFETTTRNNPSGRQGAGKWKVQAFGMRGQARGGGGGKSASASKNWRKRKERVYKSNVSSRRKRVRYLYAVARHGPRRRGTRTTGGSICRASRNGKSSNVGADTGTRAPQTPDSSLFGYR